MKPLRFPIAFTTLVLFIYVICIQYNMPFPVVFTLFVSVHLLTIWMVVEILKKGKPSDKTFNDQWYEDVNR